jgi:hypothetical protein
MYRVVTDTEVNAQVAALPDALLPYFAQVLDLLEIAPWAGEPYNEAKPDGVMRKLLFGPPGRRNGEVVYLVLEHAQIVELLRVHWIDLDPVSYS